jgi:hypothetical protein
MATPKKLLNDRAAGEIILKQVFSVVERLNALTGSHLAAKGAKRGNLTFNPKIVLYEDGDKQYACIVEIYTPASSNAGLEMNLQWSGTTIEQFQQALTTLSPALSALAKEGYLSDTLTVGRISPEGEETEIYAPDTLQPGMYRLSEAQEE